MTAKTGQTRRALIIGGNRFFGRHLAEKLLSDGVELTLLNRGQTSDGLGTGVERLVADRTDEHALIAALGDRQWDVVFDQVAFTAQDARAAKRVFTGRTPLYVFTSTVSVYKWGASIPESAFDPLNYEFDEAAEQAADYGEGKRQAECILFRSPPFRVIAVRLPVVCGSDDYTGRLQLHVDSVLQEKRIYFPNFEARMSYITSNDAGASLKFLSETDFSGPINCSSPDAVRHRDLMEWIERASGKKVLMSSTPEEGISSPYGVPHDYFPQVKLLESLGLRLRPVREWMPELIEALIHENSAGRPKQS